MRNIKEITWMTWISEYDKIEQKALCFYEIQIKPVYKMSRLK